MRPDSIRRRMAWSESTISADRRPLPTTSARSLGRPRSPTLLDPVSMLYPSMDPNERFRARRDAVRRRKRRRRAAVAGLFLLALLALAGGMTLAGKGTKTGSD